MFMLACAGSAQAQIPANLTGSCTPRTPQAGYSFELCTDGNTPVFGRTANVGGIAGVRVPAKYDGFDGLPAKASDATSVPGADADGMITLDVDISKPTLPAPPGGYPMVVFMHGCCAGDKFAWQSGDFGTGERWHYNNAWFAARGYVVVNYTSRGFRNQAGGGGSTGETELDSRLFEINDYQYLAG